MTVTRLSRADWGAGPLGSGHVVPHAQFVGLVAHHTVMVMPDYDGDGFINGDVDDVVRYMRQLQTARPDLGPEVPYSFVHFLGAQPGDTIVAEGRGQGVTGAHTIGYNSTRYGCAFAGNSITQPVTPGILDGYRAIGAELADPAGAAPTIGHRDVYATACPGTTLYAALGAIQPPFAAPPAQEEPPMDFMYVRRNRPNVLNPVYAVLDDGTVFTVVTFASFEGQRHLFGGTDKTPTAGAVAPVTDTNNDKRTVAITDDVGATFVYRLPA